MNFLHNWALLFVQKCVYEAKQMSYRWCEKMHSTFYLSCSRAFIFSVRSNKHDFSKVCSLFLAKWTEEASLENQDYTSFGPEKRMFPFLKKIFSVMLLKVETWRHISTDPVGWSSKASCIGSHMVAWFEIGPRKSIVTSRGPQEHLLNFSRCYAPLKIFNKVLPCKMPPQSELPIERGKIVQLINHVTSNATPFRI